METLENKRVVVTGGTRGIGRGIAQAFLEKGAKVLILGQKQESIDKALTEINHSNLYGAATDVSDEAQVASAFATANETMGGVDILINNAGISLGGRVEDLPLASFQRVLDVNLTGAFLCAKEAFKAMGEAGGRVINIGSISSQVPRYGSIPYTTSKFGLEGMTRALAVEGRVKGIMVSCLHPGNTYTEMWQNVPKSVELEPMMDVADVADMVIAMSMLSKDISVISATVLNQTQPFLGRG